MDLILASASSRRRLLLDQLDLTYECSTPEIDESSFNNEGPENYVQRMAFEKAIFVWNSRSGKIPVLAADTIVCKDGQLIGKPKNQRAAVKGISLLENNTHHVYTALFLKMKNYELEKTVSSVIKFKSMTSSEIQNYCSSDEPYDKAGGYAIQGIAAKFIDYFQGSYTGVMGLPMKELIVLLQDANIVRRKKHNTL